MAFIDSKAVVSLNNSSVQHMWQGEHKQALKGFRRALNSLKQSSLEDHERATAPPIDQGLLLQRIAFYSNHSETSPHNDFVYYSRTLWLNDENMDEELVSIVVLFNLAVSFHHVGLNSSSSFLNKSLEIYKMILVVAQSVCSPEYDAFVRLLLAAVFTNLGHIYSHFFCNDEAKVCREHLNHIIDSGCPLLDQDEYWLFFLNSERLCRVRGGFAPAA